MRVRTTKWEATVDRKVSERGEGGRERQRERERERERERKSEGGGGEGEEQGLWTKLRLIYHEKCEE